jgi:hypothetical protein
MQPSTRYHAAVRFVIAKYGAAFQLAGVDRIKWAAATSLAVTHVYRRFPKLTSDEVSAAVIEGAKSALDVEVLPEPVSNEVRLLLTALSLAHSFTDLECCTRFAWLCRSAKKDDRSVDFDTARLDPDAVDAVVGFVPAPRHQIDEGEMISSNV